MVYKRFQYSNGLDIIAPLKHGTRWLDEETNPLSIIEDPLSGVNLNLHKITNKTYWVYREPEEHLLSALMTEIRGTIELEEYETERIINSFMTGTGTHWGPYVFKTMFTYWNRYRVKPIHLSKLSTLFPTDVKFDKTNYQMNYYTKTKYDTDFIIDYIGNETYIKLKKLSEIDKPYLDNILNNKHNLI